MFEYELKNDPTNMPNNATVRLELYATNAQMSTDTIALTGTSGTIEIDHANIYRLQYNLEDAGVAIFKKFAFYPVTTELNLNEKFRIKALMKYAHCTDGIRPVIRLKSLRVGCNDISTGFFEFSEIRFGNPSDYSIECFRKWDFKVAKIGKLQLYPDNHCGVDAVKFALVRCQGNRLSL